MIKIRKNCFETNSSSIHAICIDTNSKLQDINFISFNFNEFGWENEMYDSISKRASYLYTAIMSIGYKEDSDKMLEKLKAILDKNNINYEFDNAEVKSYAFDNNVKEYYDFNGYIDHCGELRDLIDELLNNEELFFKYLLGDSFIITGNDNCDLPYPYMILHGEDSDNYYNYRKEPVKQEYQHYDKIYYKGN